MHSDQISLTPLGRILDEVKRCLSAKLYYAAFAVSLTLPDICAGLALPAEDFVKKTNFLEFLTKYSTESELGLDGESCFKLRGGVIHRGNASGHPFFGATNVIFCVPETKVSVHALTLQVGEKSSAMFDLTFFCEAMDSAVRRWYLENRDNVLVTTNMSNLLSWRPDGISPFFQGAPVVGSGP